jgi:hypothetical protein
MVGDPSTAFHALLHPLTRKGEVSPPQCGHRVLGDKSNVARSRSSGYVKEGEQFHCA